MQHERENITFKVIGRSSFFKLEKEKCVYLICVVTVVMAKRYNVRHFSTSHRSYHASYTLGSALRTEKASELKVTSGQSLFNSLYSRSQGKSPKKTTEVSFKATQFLIKIKKTLIGMLSKKQ